MHASDVTRFRGEFFRMLQQTGQTQAAVTTIAPGRATPAPRRSTTAIRSST
jgi:hypothetical protein